MYLTQQSTYITRQQLNHISGRSITASLNYRPTFDRNQIKLDVAQTDVRKNNNFVPTCRRNTGWSRKK